MIIFETQIDRPTDRKKNVTKRITCYEKIERNDWIEIVNVDRFLAKGESELIKRCLVFAWIQVPTTTTTTTRTALHCDLLLAFCDASLNLSLLMLQYTYLMCILFKTFFRPMLVMVVAKYSIISLLFRTDGIESMFPLLISNYTFHSHHNAPSIHKDLTQGHSNVLLLLLLLLPLLVE